MKKSQKGAWPQKLVKQAKAARACFRRFFAAHTPSPKHANQARPKPAHQAPIGPPTKRARSQPTRLAQSLSTQRTNY